MTNDHAMKYKIILLILIFTAPLPRLASGDPGKVEAELLDVLKEEQFYRESGYDPARQALFDSGAVDSLGKLVELAEQWTRDFSKAAEPVTELSVDVKYIAKNAEKNAVQIALARQEIALHDKALALDQRDIESLRASRERQDSLNRTFGEGLRTCLEAAKKGTKKTDMIIGFSVAFVLFLIKLAYTRLTGTKKGRKGEEDDLVIS